MKLKENFLLRNIAGQYIVVPVGEIKTGKKVIISLNSTGAFIWDQLKSGATLSSILNEVVQKYDIDNETAKKDILKFVEKCKVAGLIDSYKV